MAATSGRETVAAQVDWRSVGPRGPEESGRRILELSAGELMPGLAAAWAVMDGSLAAVDSLHQALVSALGPGVRPSLDGDSNPAEVACALLRDTVEGVSDCGEFLSAALVLRSGDELNLIAVGHARAFLSDELTVTELVEAPLGVEIRQASIPVHSFSTLVLVASCLQTNFSIADVRQAVKGSLNREASVEWLASLATAQGGDCASALIVQFEGRAGSPILEGASRSAIWIAGSIAAILCLLALVLLVRSLLAGGSQAARPALTGLRAASVSPTHAELAWNGIAQAQTYVVRIAGQTYRSTAPHVRVARGLHPGGIYRWQVRAQFPADSPVLSPTATLHLPELYPAPTIQAVRPHGIRSVYSAPHVEFCWRTDASSQSFDLYVVGPALHFHHRYQRGELHIGRRGALCATMGVASNASYAWRAGAAAPDRREGWTAWTHFWFGQTSRRTSTVAVQSAARSVAAAIPHPTKVTAAASVVQVEPTSVPTRTLPLSTPTPITVAARASLTKSPAYAKVPAPAQPTSISNRRDLAKAGSRSTTHATTDRPRARRSSTSLPQPPPPPPAPNATTGP